MILALLAAMVAGCAADQTADEMLPFDHGKFDQRAVTGLRPVTDIVAPGSTPDRVPWSFNALAAGTRALPVGEMDRVWASIDAIRSMPGLVTRDSMFLKALEDLATKKHMTHREAFFSRSGTCSIRGDPDGQGDVEPVTRQPWPTRFPPPRSRSIPAALDPLPPPAPAR